MVIFHSAPRASRFRVGVGDFSAQLRALAEGGFDQAALDFEAGEWEPARPFTREVAEINLQLFYYKS